jgi:hypothetical protein
VKIALRRITGGTRDPGILRGEDHMPEMTGATMEMPGASPG